MANKHFNSLPIFSISKSVNVDRENGVLRNVEIAKFGKNKNQSYFNQKFLDDLVEKGNAQSQGVKSRFGHPNACMNSLGTYVGRFKEFSQKDGKVYANLYLCDTAKNTPNGNLYDYVLNMSEKNPDMFGNSIVIDCYSDQEHIKNEAGEDEVVEALILDALISSDLVDDPAATDALFSANPNDLGAILTNFLDDNPTVFDAVNKHPEIIHDFFERYFNYSQRKSLTPFNMSFFDKFKKKVDKGNDKFDINLTLADGAIVTVVTEAEQPKVGDKVNDSEGNPVNDGEHLLPDGGAIVTEAGAITEITEPGLNDGDGTEDPTPAEVMNSVNALSKKFDTFIGTFAKTQKDNEQAFDLLADRFSAIDQKVTLMGKGITSKPIGDHTAGNPKDKFNQSREGGYDPEKARELREKNTK